MTKKSGLGKGLDALIPIAPEDSAIPASGIDTVPITSILPNPQQPRTEFNQEELQDLANSITEHGIIQPLIVTRGSQPNQYILIAGERRLQASKLASLQKVPVVIRKANNQELLELALVENVQRADLSPLETADAYKRLGEEYNLTQDQIAERVGKSRTAVTNTISLLNLAPAVKKALAEGKITEGHARALKGLSHQAQAAALPKVIKNLSVRETEELARRLKGQKSAKPLPKKALPPEVIDLENRLRDQLGTKITMTYSAKGGTIILHYYSDEELNALTDKLLEDKN